MDTIDYIRISNNIQLIEDTLNLIINLMCVKDKDRLDIDLIADQIILRTNLKPITKQIIIEIINEYIRYSLINKACLFRKPSKTNSYVDLRSLLINDNPTEDYFICKFDKSHRLNCVHKKSNCVNCNKWNNDRKLFKQQINEIISVDDITDGLKLLPNTIHLLPTVILEKDPYDNYIKTLDAYIKSK